MKTEFDITLTEQDMYRFSMYHTYTGIHGIASVIIAVLIFFAAMKTYGEVEPIYTVLYIAFAIIFMVYMPISLYLRAKQQLRTSETLRNSLHYQIDEKGIHTSQKDAAAELPWEQVYKIISTRHNVLVYSSRIHAYVIPRDQIANQYAAFREIAEAQLPDYRFKMK